ncbi:hypothetical protein STEG23_007881, partial [Scotinomys teguina]
LAWGPASNLYRNTQRLKTIAGILGDMQRKDCLSQKRGCVPLRGPSTVTGTVGESLSVQCQYEKEYKNNDKYWCRVPLLPLCKDIVKTRASKEAKNGRVSIRDHPANLTFTVTLENLTLEDASTYKCGVDIPASIGINFSLGIDDSFKIMVSVVPGQLPEPAPRTSTVPTSLTTSLTTSLATECSTQGSIVKDQYEHTGSQGLSLSVLLTVLALLLFLLVGTSLLAWRMFRKHRIEARCLRLFPASFELDPADLDCPASFELDPADLDCPASFELDPADLDCPASFELDPADLDRLAQQSPQHPSEA